MFPRRAELTDRIKKAGRHVSQNEGLIFEQSAPGKRGIELPPLDVPAVDARAALGADYAREGIEGFPEVSEIEVIRHFTRLSTWNYAIDLGMYPLGSCTMKYNLRVNEFVARLKEIVNCDVAAMMVTNPSTLGVFEQNIAEAADVLHSHGALLYMDGANMNALAGVARPGDFGVDVMHLNLHKTFSTPHGGGGPGAGPVMVKRILAPYLPIPVLGEKNGRPALENSRPKSIGRVRAFGGNFGVLVRALAYTLAYGPGIRQATEDAVLNANYIRKKLEDVYDLPYKSSSMHEVVFSDARQKKNGVSTMDIAKRLIDYGFHPYTTAFPLIVSGALMIEPTESESKQECDLFVDAMRSIAEEAATNPELVKTAPHSTRVSRLDDVAAARKPVLRWKPKKSTTASS